MRIALDTWQFFEVELPDDTDLDNIELNKEAIEQAIDLLKSGSVELRFERRLNNDDTILNLEG